MTTSSSERILALIAKWEYECCGDPLHVGDATDLTLTSAPQGPLAGPDGRTVDLLVEHHVPAGPMRHVRARVVGLWEWRIQREIRDGDGTWYPVTGTEEFMPIPRMDVWGEWQPTDTDALPEGWAVELDVIAELPPLPDEGMYGI